MHDSSRRTSRGTRLLYRCFEPRPRIVTSAFTIALAAAALAFVLPASRMSSTGRSWSVFVSRGESGLTIYPESPERPILENWVLELHWSRVARGGRVKGELRSSVTRTDADHARLPAPSPGDKRGVLLAWAERTGEDDPLLLAAIRSPIGRVEVWDLPVVAVEAGHWAVKLLFLGSIVLGVGRMAVRSGYERSIRWWRDGKCPACGYPTDGVPGGVCPECGCVGAAYVRILLRILRPK